MSTKTGLAEITAVKDFSSDAVLAHFFITPEQKAEAAAFRFIYKQMYREVYSKSLGRLAAAREAVKLTIEHCQLAYDLFQSYSADFLKNTKGSRDALIIAALLGPLVSHANDSRNKKLDFAENLMIQISMLHYNSDKLCDGQFEQPYELPDIFLALIKSMKLLSEVENDLDEMTLTDLTGVLNNDIKVIKKLSRPFKETEIGTALRENRKIVKAEISARIANYGEQMGTLPPVETEEEMGKIIPVPYPLAKPVTPSP